MPKTILLIDDSALFRSVMGKALETAGYQVLTAESGETGFQIFLEKNPDLIVSDLLMPEETGAHLIRKIRQHPEGKTIPVIMITGVRGGGAFATDAIGHWGVNAFFSKDTDFSFVLQKVAELIGGSKNSRDKKSVKNKQVKQLIRKADL